MCNLALDPLLFEVRGYSFMRRKRVICGDLFGRVACLVFLSSMAFTDWVRLLGKHIDRLKCGIHAYVTSLQFALAR